MRSPRSLAVGIAALAALVAACDDPVAVEPDAGVVAEPDAGIDAGPDAGTEEPDGGTCGAPDAPGDVHAEAGNAEATVSWTAPLLACGGPVLSYTVTVLPGGAAQTTNGDATSLVISGLENGTSYTFTVRTNVASGASVDSTPSSPVVPRTVPSAPQQFAAEGGSRSVTLTWNAGRTNGGSAVTGYVVLRSTAGAAVTEAGRTDAGALAFVDTGLEDGVVYDYEVRAVNAAGEGAGATTQAITLPAPPTELHAVATGDSIALQWTAVRGAERYRVLSSLDPETGFAERGTADTTAFVDDELLAGTHYTYVVRAENAAGLGPQSDEAGDTTAPAPPLGLTAVAQTHEGLPRVALSWTPSPGAASYVVLRSSTSGAGYQQIAALSDTTFDDDTVGAARTYVHVVRAVAPAGTSAPSNETSTTTTTLAPLSPTLASAPITNERAVELTVARCVGRAALLVNEGAAPTVESGDWQPCALTPGAITTTLAGDSQGTRILHVWSHDAHGNVDGPETVTLTFDSTPPELQLANIPSPLRGGSARTVAWSVTEAHPVPSSSFTVELSTDDGSTWSQLATTAAPVGALTEAQLTQAWTIPTLDAARARVRVSFTDRAGNMSTATSAAFVIDSSPPRLTANAFTLDGGAATTRSHVVRVALGASDSLSKITRFCLKTNAVTPASGDACWVRVDATPPALVPATTLALSAFPWSFGFLTGRYEIFGWVEDEVSHVSVRTGAACTTSTGTDCAAITLTSPEPPRISVIRATRTDTPATPPTTSDLRIDAGQPVFVQWQVSDQDPLPTSAISLSWTTDDVTYTPIAAGLSNAAGSGCTLSGALTGCYRWTSPGAPTNGTFKVRITVTNAESVTATATASANNVAAIQFIAGNTDPGLGASAKAAVFFNEMTDGDEDPQSFAVDSAGTFYFRDARRGLLVVRPSDGLQRLLIPTTGVMSPDGPVASATLQRPLRIAIDHADRLLVYDHDRIRRYDPVAGTFTTLIGGGTSSADGVGPLEVVNAALPLQLFRSKAIGFTALPNGDVYFQDKSNVTPTAGYRLRKLNAATNRVQSITPNGLGIGTLPTQDVAQCTFAGTVLAYDPAASSLTHFGAQALNSCGAWWASFDPVTGTTRTPAIPTGSLASWITGMNGTAYVFSTTHGYTTDNFIKRYDLSTNTLVTVVGTGAAGSCPDDTPALSCAITPRDAFVTAQGQLFFMDRARLRTVDPATGKVVTVMGQSFAHGDDGPALAARFGANGSISLLDNGEIIVSDNREKRFRQFAIGGNIRTIAGNGIDGSIDRTKPANAQPVPFYGYWLADDVAANPATGELLVVSAGYILKLNRTTGLWERLAGGGATLVSNADGLVGSAINVGSSGSRALGFDGTRFLLSFTGNAGGPFYKLYSGVDGTQSGLMGVNGTEGTIAYCADGTAGSACPVPSPLRLNHTRATWDAYASRWAIMGSGATAIRSITSGGNLGTITTLANAARSFAYRHDASTHIAYYCSQTDQMLHKKDLATGVETTLAWPIASVHCSGRALIYDPRRNTLVFPYEQDGLYGIAEYLAP